jgi:hypothetical protein
MLKGELLKFRVPIELTYCATISLGGAPRLTAWQVDARDLPANRSSVMLSNDQDGHYVGAVPHFDTEWQAGRNVFQMRISQFAK